MMKRALAVVVSLGALASGLAVLAAKADTPPPLPLERQLSGGAPSADALLDRLLDALAANDEAALHSLRVTESEYLSIIAPGTVPVGAPPRETPKEVSEFYWRLLDAKSRDLGRVLLHDFGGLRFHRKDVRFTRGTKEYAWYTASGETRLLVENDGGVESLVRTGWIAHVGDQYKFIGLNWNN